MKTYICIVCGFVYDEASGRPEDGLAPGTLWADVPATWACPDCGVAKAEERHTKHYQSVLDSVAAK